MIYIAKNIKENIKKYVNDNPIKNCEPYVEAIARYISSESAISEKELYIDAIMSLNVSQNNLALLKELEELKFGFNETCDSSPGGKTWKRWYWADRKGLKGQKRPYKSDISISKLKEIYKKLKKLQK